MPAVATYTYSSNPATDDKDAVRVLLADTNFDGKGWMLSDEEIIWSLAQNGGQYQSAAQCAELIAARFTGPKRNIIDKRVGDLTISGPRTGGLDDWYSLARSLRRRAARGAIPVAGGVEVSDREDRQDPSLLQPEFVRGMDNYQPNTRVDLDGQSQADQIL